uniref:Plastid-encoded RNA polymerase subunit alpha n=1 Tax=Characiochloris acuminata TaxID=167768 RepID=A0A0S2LQ20_9CHLO|nr:alpha subunit of RNA polymerase [Characiochloris acuminata]ALO63305.1 alpha subunit of RNA polymerase [Characiochloris acuminata]
MTNFFITCKESRIENNRSFYGCFYLGPFEAGQSITVANALRRTLLSSIKGIGITSVQIENAFHEYSTLTGVRDSVLDILLNLKEIVLKKTTSKKLLTIYSGHSHSRNREANARPVPELADALPELNESFNSLKRPQVGYLKARGPGIIKAKDLRLPPFIHCVDPEQYIATLAEDGVLNMKFLILTNSMGSSDSRTNISSSGRSTNDHATRFKKALASSNIPSNDLECLTLKNRKRRLLLKTIKHELNEVNLKTHVLADARSATPSSLTNIVSLNEASTSEAPQPLGDSAMKTTIFNSTRFRTKDSFPKTKISPVFNDSNPLKIDTVFNPITKVNYIIEVSDSKVVNSSFEKGKWLSKLENIINGSVINQNQNNYHISDRTIDNNLKANEMNKLNSLRSLFISEVSTLSALSEHGTSSYVNSSELQNLTEVSSLYCSQIEANSIKQNVILEIWTNGSIHPRDAFYISLKHLIRLFRTLVISTNQNRQVSER